MKHIFSKYWLGIAGLVSIFAGVGLSIFTPASEVPNDPNIGAGILLLFGLIALGVAVLQAWLVRRTSTQMPPAPQPHAPPSGGIDRL
ncbi:MAG: hypothetical protein HKN03_13920 [Acidimicrobiales bacterium]|nr:hypothetical protein [Acidimicrobiales bacterium]